MMHFGVTPFDSFFNEVEQILNSIFNELDRMSSTKSTGKKWLFLAKNEAKWKTKLNQFANSKD